MQSSLQTLLQTWCEGLLAQQVGEGDDRGGLWCPDCGRVHGRCGDAIYPFLHQARHSGEARYIRAATQVFDWSERHVSQSDGSWINDPVVNDWTGITVFSSLALSEALHFHGDLLPHEVRSAWMERLRCAADWIALKDWSDHGTMNYPISASGALASASRTLQDPALLTTSRQWAGWAREFFLPDGIVFGEGAREPTPRGVYAVDALYNCEESLPNLALYAAIAGDTQARDLVLRSFAAHLEFLLPDGSYDAGWCSRSFKWTLWGSRTSDGLAGLLPLSRFDERIGEAVRRNVEYLSACTHDGLLHGGPHLKYHGRPPCIHHTFAHAKALAAALDAGEFGEATIEAPNDRPRGIRHRPELGTTFVSLGDWRASFTVSDVFYGARGSHASGGSPTMLWHRATGPLCVSSMSHYDLIEGGNMAHAQSADEISILTPRLEHGEFGSELDWQARLETLPDGVRAEGHLTNLHEKTAGAFSLETRFEGGSVHFHARGEGANFVLPIVSRDDEAVRFSPHRVEIDKPGAQVVLESDAVLRGDARRVFHFVPGVQAVRLEVAVPAGGARVSLHVHRNAAAA